MRPPTAPAPRRHQPPSHDALARRAAAVVLAVVATMAALLAAASPFADGDAGWSRAITAALVAAALLYDRRTRLGRGVPGVTAVATLTLAALAGLHWAAHHDATPFQQLYVLPGLLVAAFAGLRQTVGVYAAIAALEAIPRLASHPEPADGAVVLTDIVVVGGLLALAHLWGRSIRTREHALIADRRRVERESRLDALTGLPNRRAFEEELGHAVRRREPVAVILVDVNGFKDINDRLGHLEGDRTLQAVAAALQGSLRPQDLASRWGGDEFALLVRGVSAEQATETARRADAHVRRDCRTRDDTPVSVKWGVAAPTGDRSASALMDDADAALVRATHAASMRRAPRPRR